MTKLYYQIDINPSSKLHMIHCMHDSSNTIYLHTIGRQYIHSTKAQHNPDLQSLFIFQKCIQITSASSSRTIQLTLKGEGLALFIVKTDPGGEGPLNKQLQA